MYIIPFSFFSINQSSFFLFINTKWVLLYLWRKNPLHRFLSFFHLICSIRNIRERKEGRRFVHKSALIEKVLRTSTIILNLLDLDELNIFCHKAWSPERFLKKFCPSEFLELWYTLPLFYINSISTVEWAEQSSLCIGGIARKPRPATAERCSIDLTDLADFSTDDTCIWVENNPRVSAQTDVPLQRYDSCK